MSSLVENTDTAQLYSNNQHEVKKTSADDMDLRRRCCDFKRSEFFKVEKSLIKYKGFYFFFHGAQGSVFPFLGVYNKQLGFSPNQIGIISGLRPLVGFCSGPTWGSIADRFRIRRIMLLISVLGWLGFITSVGYVPPAKYERNCTFVNSGSTINSNASETFLGDRGWMYDRTDLTRVFVTIFVLMTLGEVVQSPTGALADAGCVEGLGACDTHKYGHQRAWGSISLGAFALLVGAVLNTTREDIKPCGIELTTCNYRIAFYFFAGCMTCAFITCFFFKFHEQNREQTEGRRKPSPLKVIRMVLTLHYGSWLFTILFTGVCNGIILGFLFWHLENIGGTQLVMGLASNICSVSEVVTFFLVFRLLKKVGYLPFMVLGLTSYCVRFLVYGFMENPWIVLPFEILQGFTFAGIWVVYTKYLCESVPSEYLGTIQGFLHGVYWGLGSGSGHMLGGILVEAWGARVTFRIFAIASFINMLIFLLIQKALTGGFKTLFDSSMDNELP